MSTQPTPDYYSPALYKKSSTGKILAWRIKVVKDTLYTYHGYQGGQTQISVDVIKEGKNLGKVNETSILEQAIAEGKALYSKKLKSGYVTSSKDALEGKVDKVIEGGVLPMLAHTVEKHYNKMDFPALVQPKLDGIRCIAVKKGEDVTLWTRTRKPITSCPHVVDAILRVFKETQEITLDGELYNHDLRHDFERIVSGVRSAEPNENSLIAQYHIYDIIGTQEQDVRIHYLTKLMKRHPTINNGARLVYTLKVDSPQDAEAFAISCIDGGYEGAMVRSLKGLYENKRSYNLLKYKTFTDAEFKVVGVVEGRGKLTGLVGSFTCVTKDGVSFDVKPKGNQDDSAKYIRKPSLAIGKYLVVKFQGLTGKNKVPRFPIGLRFRDSIDF